MERWTDWLRANPTAHHLRLALENDLLTELRTGACVATGELIPGGDRVRFTASHWQSWILDFVNCRGLAAGQVVAWEVRLFRSGEQSLSDGQRTRRHDEKRSEIIAAIRELWMVDGKLRMPGTRKRQAIIIGEMIGSVVTARTLNRAIQTIERELS
jgi:hypothetical protein